MRYPVFRQLDSRDCGPTCLRMLAAHYGKSVNAVSSRGLCGQYRNGTTMFTISQGARELGFQTIGVRWTAQRLQQCFDSPCIVQWRKKHFIVVWQVTEKEVKVSDPAVGALTYSFADFCMGWLSHTDDNGNACGMVLLAVPGASFETIPVKATKDGYTLRRMAPFLAPHKWLLLQLLMSLFLGCTISLVVPFLTQSVVDIGIAGSNTRFVFCVLTGQMLLSFGLCVNRYISSWLALHISSRVSISMVSHFLEKLMKMKITFFDSKRIGDIMTRIQDFTRIETFLTSYMISILMAVVAVLVYGFVLARYGKTLLGVYLFCMILYLTWTISFRNRRRKLDYMRFQQVSENQSMVIHYIQGMQEIKLNCCEKQKLQKWQKLQMQLYDINVKGLAMAQMQDTGAILIDSFKKNIITFICAWCVINADMTVGMMMAVTYVLGQLDGPFHQFSSFIQAMQDAQVSLERVNEITCQTDEMQQDIGKVKSIRCNRGIQINHIRFRYPGPERKWVLDDVTINIKKGSVTAIVGESGSGKSTLLKLLIGFYEPQEGIIKLDDIPFQDIDKRTWRQKCSAVQQTGYLFTETIAQNIATGQDDYDIQLVMKAAQAAEIHEFIMSLPLKYETIIGEDGMNLSGGQRQRIFIARAIYRNTPFVFLDEATNALDACNEESILKNLTGFYQNRTVVIVAHRLSTIMKADNIIVLKEGRVVEQGSHNQLMDKVGYYYTLISKQTEEYGNKI